MEQKHHNSGGSGFLAGVLVGVVITLLFTTKKGREIFKETVDRAIDKFNDLQDKVETKLDEQEVFDDEDEGDDYVKPELPPLPSPVQPTKEVKYLASETQEESDSGEEEAPAKPKHVESKHAEPKHVEPKTEEEETEAVPKKSSGVRKFFRRKS